MNSQHKVKKKTSPPLINLPLPCTGHVSVFLQFLEHSGMKAAILRCCLCFFYFLWVATSWCLANLAFFAKNRFHLFFSILQVVVKTLPLHFSKVPSLTHSTLILQHEKIESSWLNVANNCSYPILDFKNNVCDQNI